jgi:Domain of unknown function (DUF4440)
MLRSTLTGAGLLLALSAAAADKTPAPRLSRPGSAELTAAIKARDEAVFAAVFDRCDLAAVGKLITEDLEFYHDQGGVTADSGPAFVESIRQLCARQASGEDYRSRRELVADSLFVQPLGDYGAIETGTHRFYRLDPGKPARLTGEARFAHVWKNDAGSWKLARVLSYAHSEVPTAGD